MRLFKRKKKPLVSISNSKCTFCGSPNTMLNVPEGAEYAVKTWRGQRFVERRCRDCGQYFFVDAPSTEEIENELESGDGIDEETLRLAEEDLKNQADDNEDHRYNPY